MRDIFGGAKGIRRKRTLDASVIAERASFTCRAKRLRKQTVLSHLRAMRGHFVLCLFAMSATHDFRKCYALASLFACGYPAGVRVAEQRHDEIVGIPCLQIKKSYTKYDIFLVEPRGFVGSVP
mgnify:CR=1 FL=1